MTSRLRSRAPALLGVAVVLGLGFVGWRKPWRKARPSPEAVLYGELVPAWVVARNQGPGSAAGEAFGRVMAASTSWPRVGEALRALDAVWDNDVPGPQGWRAAVAGVNAANDETHLPVWLAAETPGGHPVVLTYTIAGRTRWSRGARAVEVLDVRRLDHLNVELAAVGHAHGDRPVVLLDEVEREVVKHLQTPPGGESEGTATDRAVRGLWRRTLGTHAGDAKDERDAEAVRATVAALDARNTAFAKLGQWLVRLGVGAEAPARFDDGKAVAEALRTLFAPSPYAGLVKDELRALDAASTALEAEPVRHVLARARGWEAASTAAHEAHHALEAPEDGDEQERAVAPAISEAVGHHSPAFMQSVQSELAAFLGELHDTAAPPCLALAGLAEQVRGKTARATPHFYAGWLVFRALGEGEPTDAAVAATLTARCAQEPSAFRAAIGDLAGRLLARPLPTARAAELPSSGESSRNPAEGR